MTLPPYTNGGTQEPSIYVPGVHVGEEGDKKKDLGNFYEQMDDELKSALSQLRFNFKYESSSARRAEVRKAKQARMYWRGMQNIYWDEVEQIWQAPFSQSGGYGTSFSDQPARYDFVTNIYQAFGLTIIAVLSAAVPNTVFLPQDADQHDDRSTAREAQMIAELIERNNHAAELIKQIAYLCWTDGKVASYVRYVTDGPRFGWKELPDLQAQEVMLAQDYRCYNCGAQVDVLNNSKICLNCGAQLGEPPAPIASEIPQQMGTIKVPNGQEVIDILGALEVQTPIWANKQDDFPYLLWTMETHLGRIRAAYPHMKDKLPGYAGGGGAYGESGTDQYEREARLRVQYGGYYYGEGGYSGNDLITYERVWFRPWAFSMIEDEGIQKQLLELFPEGAFCAFAAEFLAEARPENMDDHWTIMQALPGDGQDRPAIGTSFISVQDRYNTLDNLVVENIEYGVPITYADSEVVDFDAIEEQDAAPGAIVPVQTHLNRRVDESFFQSQPSQLPLDTYRYMNDLLGPVGQFVTGGLPALWGGSQENVDTATGQTLMRDQAMGRIGIPYRASTAFWNLTVLKGVEVFRVNRDEDVSYSVLGKHSDYERRLIRQENLRGNLTINVDGSDQYPLLWTQIRGMLLGMVNSGNELFLQVFADQRNQEQLKNALGLPDLKMPGEDIRNKQLGEIQEMLQQKPIPAPDGKLLSSVPVDEFADEHEAEFVVCKQWLNSPEGQQAKVENVAGWWNVRAHAMLHMAIVQLRALEAANASLEEEERQQEKSATRETQRKIEFEQSKQPAGSPSEGAQL